VESIKILHKNFLSQKKSIYSHVENYLKKIEENADLNAFIRIYADEALEKAQILDEKIKNGEEVGEFAGIVVAIKDNISYKNHKLTCGSKILEGFEAKYNAFVTQKLLDEDAIIIGHTNMDEFAMGSSNETSVYGNVLNPVDKTRVPGGSSGGSAAVVAADLVDFSLGSDTGGSIRQPAAFTGIIGMKPSYGTVSRNGVVAFGSSLDQIGPFTKSSDDLAYVLDLLVDHDKNDSTSVKFPKNTNFSSFLNKKIENFRIGIDKSLFSKGLEPEIKEKTEKLIKNLEKNGAEIVDISLPHLKYSIAVYYIIATAEASANLSRFDGIRYGHRTENTPKNLDDLYKQTRSEGFGEEVKRRIMLGTFVLSHGYYDAYYKKAQKVRQLIKQDFREAFKKCDLILTPSTPKAAFKFNEHSGDPLSMYLADIYTAGLNLAGIPGISVPFAKNKENLPIGVQFISDFFEEEKLVQITDFIGKKRKEL
jgi:aspartyl-tRNA(Asn)/glutamyl-tRNA(Gln) amidotransferase subunit A